MTDLTEADRAAIAEVRAQIAEGRAIEQARLDQRDDMIRRHLAQGVPYKQLAEAWGLDRSMLDLIRQGKRTRTD